MTVPSRTTYDERPLPEVERSFERLCAEGRIVVEAATAEDRARARMPAHTGPVFRQLAGTVRSVRLVDADVTVVLHQGSIANDTLGGWRFEANLEEIDVRLAPTDTDIANATGDMILDATWSPQSQHEVVLHSTILHFIVRAVAGDRD
jgi:hypothetical protein